MTTTPTRPTSPDRLHPACLRTAVLFAVAVASTGAAAQTVEFRQAIRQCGTLLSDRIDPECAGKKQVLLHAAGLQRTTTEPTSVEEEQIDERPTELRDINQQMRLERRRKESLLSLFPDESRHHAARVRDLAAKDGPIKAAEGRIEGLRQERRALAAEAAIYNNRVMPPELKLRLDRNDSAWREARSAIADSQAERTLVGKNYDEELAVLKKLWAARGRS